MKKKISLLCSLLICLHSYNYANSTKKIMGEFSSQETSGLTSPQFTKPLTPATINNNGTQNIKRSGYYFLTDDLMFYPMQLWSPDKPTINWGGQTTPKSILCISSDNVILDLNRKTISQKTDNNLSLQQANLVGVYIKPGLKNITIKNGAFNGLSGAGILIGANCNNINIDNIATVGCSMAGIIIGHNPFDTATYSSTHDGFENIQYFDPETCVDNSTDDIIINNCHISGSTGYYTYEDSGTKYVYSHAIGLFMSDCSNVQIANSVFNSNKYGAPSVKKNSDDNPGGYYNATRQGYNGYGIYMLRCKNAHLENIECCNNTGWAAYGFHFQNSSNMICKNCFAKNNTGEGDPILHQTFCGINFDWSHRYLGRAAGFMLKDASGNFQSCVANSNRGNREAVGFWFKRDTILTAASTITVPPCRDATLFSPTASTYNDCNQTILMTDIGAMALPNYHSLMADPPTQGAGYTIPTEPLYVFDSGSNSNQVIDCDSFGNESVYLDAYGFLSEGNSNTNISRCQAADNHGGMGTEDYEASSGLSDYDNGVGKWSLAEYNRYTNSFTGKVMRISAGFGYRSTRIPISEWNGTSYSLKVDDGDFVFLGVVIDDSDPALHVVLDWPEISSSISESQSRDNKGDVVGPGVGILLNGAFKSLISKNWLYCNSSSTAGSVVNETAGIGAHGGYGLFDLASNSTSLIKENYAFANQIIRPKVITDNGPPVVTAWAAYIEGANYYNTYSDTDQTLPIERATVGDFSSLVTAVPFTNYEWETTSVVTPYNIKSKTIVESVPPIYTP